jgi:hypothetical protein
VRERPKRSKPLQRFLWGDPSERKRLKRFATWMQFQATSLKQGVKMMPKKSLQRELERVETLSVTG